MYLSLRKLESNCYVSFRIDKTPFSDVDSAISNVSYQVNILIRIALFLLCHTPESA